MAERYLDTQIKNFLYFKLIVIHKYIESFLKMKSIINHGGFKMEKKEEIHMEKLVSERGDSVKKAVDNWFEQIPKEKLDKPFMASLGMESKISTPRDLYKELTDQISRRSISREKAGLLKEIIDKYGVGEK